MNKVWGKDAASVEAVAEAWASIDGRLPRYLADKAGDLPESDGSYEGYRAEAAELIDRIEARGFKIVPFP